MIVCPLDAGDVLSGFVLGGVAGALLALVGCHLDDRSHRPARPEMLPMSARELQFTAALNAFALAHQVLGRFSRPTPPLDLLTEDDAQAWVARTRGQLRELAGFPRTE